MTGRRWWNQSRLCEILQLLVWCVVLWWQFTWWQVYQPTHPKSFCLGLKDCLGWFLKECRVGWYRAEMQQHRKPTVQPEPGLSGHEFQLRCAICAQVILTWLHRFSIDSCSKASVEGLNWLTWNQIKHTASRKDLCIFMYLLTPFFLSPSGIELQLRAGMCIVGLR